MITMDPQPQDHTEIKAELARLLARAYLRHLINQKELDDRVPVEPSCEQWPLVDGHDPTHEETP